MLYLYRKFTDDDMKSNVLFAFISGAVLGAAAALLFAPEAGEETRKKIKDTVDSEYQSLKEKYAEYKSRQNSEQDRTAPAEPQA